MCSGLLQASGLLKRLHPIGFPVHAQWRCIAFHVMAEVLKSAKNGTGCSRPAMQCIAAVTSDDWSAASIGTLHSIQGWKQKGATDSNQSCVQGHLSCEIALLDQIHSSHSQIPILLVIVWQRWCSRFTQFNGKNIEDIYYRWTFLANTWNMSHWTFSLSMCSFIYTGCFFNWYPPKKLMYGKPRLDKSTLT